MSDKEEFMKALKENTDKGLIKVHFTLDAEEGGPAGESVWATPIGKKFAKIANIPFFVSEVSIDDIVEIEPNDESICKEFVGLATKGSRKYFIQYQVSSNEQETVGTFAQICETIKKFSGKVEGAAVGFCMAAFPVDITERDVEQILKNIPSILEFSSAEE
jgi:hypothetical protein